MHTDHSQRPHRPDSSDEKAGPINDPVDIVRRSSGYLLVVSIFLIGINLRPTLTGVGPVLESIRTNLGMSAASISFLITLPILCFGVFAPIVPRLLRFQSAERIVLFSLLALASGIGLRSLFATTGLFIGTMLAGVSISIIMVLLPSIVKRRLPQQASLMMGLYSMSLCIGAAVGAGITVPLQNAAGGDWRWALAVWLIPALFAAAVWSRQTPKTQTHKSPTHTMTHGLASSWVAWNVTFYTGLQAVLAYCVFGWLPAILVDREMTPLSAGFVLSATIGMQLVTALTGPWLATRGRDQRSMVALMMALTLTGLLGCMYGPIESIWLWAILLGLGQGGSLSISLLMLVLRSPNTLIAASLAGMAQGIGYTMAALGPLVVGLLHDYSGNWHSSAVFFVIAAIAGLAAGLSAGRARYIDGSVTAPSPT